MHRTYGLINHSEKETSGKTKQIRKGNQWSHQTYQKRNQKLDLPNQWKQPVVRPIKSQNGTSGQTN